MVSPTDYDAVGYCNKFITLLRADGELRLPCSVLVECRAVVVGSPGLLYTHGLKYLQDVQAWK